MAVTAVGPGQSLHGIGVGPGDNNLAVTAQEAPLGQGNRPTFRRAHNQCAQGIAGAGQVIADGAVIASGHIIGDQQYPPAPRCSLVQQIHRLADGQVCPVTLCRHDGRVQNPEHGFDGAEVFGQWRNGVGITGVHQQGGQAAAPLCQQVPNLALGQGQPVRFGIGGQHGQRQVQHNYQAVFRLFERGRGLAPARARQADRQDQQGDVQWQQRRTAGTVRGTLPRFV